MVWVLAVMMFAALVQSIGGFGFSLMAVPLAAVLIDLRTAVIVVSIGSLINVSLLCWRTRHDIDRSLAVRFNVPAMFGLPIGLVVLSFADQRALKVTLGALIIVATLALVRGASGLRPRAWTDVLAGWVSGILSTATGTNGPPLVLAAQMHRLEPAAFRATLAFTFTLSGSTTLALYVATHLVRLDDLSLAIAAVPLILVGQYLGLRLQRVFLGRRFDHLVYGLLLVSGVSVGASGLLG